ncbi:anti-anti-sigma factor [Labrenzia sp. EL_195]|nr:anti-anti-sigma factor [Labrenzia sp. EL_195]
MDIADNLKVNLVVQENTCIASIEGRIDSSNATKLTEYLTQVIAERGPTMILDLKDLSYLTSAGFRAMLITTDEAEEKGGALTLCNVSPDMKELFEMGGMIDVFVIHENIDAAVSSRQHNASI